MYGIVNAIQHVAAVFFLLFITEDIPELIGATVSCEITVVNHKAVFISMGVAIRPVQLEFCNCLTHGSHLG